MLLYLPLITTVLFYCLYLYFTRTFNYWKKRNVIGPKPVPLFGNIKDSTLRRTAIATTFKKIYDEFPKEKVVGVYRMTTPCLLIRDLDIIKHIMVKDFDDFVDRGIEFSKKDLGVNIFHADGDDWRVLRNRFTPLFTTGKLKNMFYLINEYGTKFVNYVENFCAKQPEQEVHLLVQKYTMATISACAFGLDVDIFNDKDDALKRIDKLIFTANLFSELDMMYPGILKKINGSIFPAEVNKFFLELVRTVINARNGVPSKRQDFMDLILQLRQKGEIESTKRYDDDVKFSLELTESVIAAQAFVFYAAGYETSATTMAFMLYQLALNPDIQEKLYSEIDAVLRKNNNELNYEVLKEMTYLGKVFDETLRMYPLVDPLLRNARRDYMVPGTDVIIKKGQTVLITPLGIQHDEKYYPDPEKFDPERFAPENVRDRHPCAYLPFGIGPRNCIGLRFAKIQSWICMVKFLSKFRVEPSPNTAKSMTFDPKRFLLSPQGGIHLNIAVRK